MIVHKRTPRGRDGPWTETPLIGWVGRARSSRLLLPRTPQGNIQSGLIGIKARAGVLQVEDNCVESAQQRLPRPRSASVRHNSYRTEIPVLWSLESSMSAESTLVAIPCSGEKMATSLIPDALASTSMVRRPWNRGQWRWSQADAGLAAVVRSNGANFCCSRTSMPTAT